MQLILRVLFGLLLSPLGMMPVAHAQSANAYVVTYIEVAPFAKNETLGLLRKLAKASKKEAGNISFVTLQRIDRPNHFSIQEMWTDQKAQESHAAAAHTKQFRDKLKPLLIAAFDERPHSALAAVAKPAAGGSGAIYAVTHVDIIPPKKDDGIAGAKALSGPSRKESGNQRYDVLQQNSRPNHMTLVEVWKDMKSLEGHETSAHMQQFREQLLPMSGSLYDQRLYRAFN